MFILTRYPIIPIVCHVSIGIGTMQTEGSIRINIRNRRESQKLLKLICSSPLLAKPRIPRSLLCWQCCRYVHGDDHNRNNDF